LFWNAQPNHCKALAQTLTQMRRHGKVRRLLLIFAADSSLKSQACSSLLTFQVPVLQQQKNLQIFHQTCAGFRLNVGINDKSGHRLFKGFNKKPARSAVLSQSIAIWQKVKIFKGWVENW
jgi:hypothetical protein